MTSALMLRYSASESGIASRPIWSESLTVDADDSWLMKKLCDVRATC